MSWIDINQTIASGGFVADEYSQKELREKQGLSDDLTSSFVLDAITL